MLDSINTLLKENISGPYAEALIIGIELIGMALIAIVSYHAFRKIENIAMHFISKSSTTWDDDLLNDRFLRAVSNLMPALVVYYLSPLVFSSITGSAGWVHVATECYILWTIIFIGLVFVSNLFNALSNRERLKAYAIKGIFQMVKLVLIGIGVIMTISIIIDKSPTSILMALGASAAILVIVFKDALLGLVASVQLTANDMLKKGDWIVMDSSGANGEVIDISLTTVKVRNWDNTVTTIPPYALISSSFQNYQPMRHSGGRRISRSILIDAASVRFCTPEEIADLQKEGWLDSDTFDPEVKQINLQLLRCYLEKYISSREDIRKDMLTLVRQMDPTPTGLPLQLYCFCAYTDWKEYERVQSEVFDHVYAVVPKFGLRIYQIIGQNN